MIQLDEAIRIAMYQMKLSLTTVDKQQCIANSIHHGILIYNLDDGIQSKTDTMLVILDTII